MTLRICVLLTLIFGPLGALSADSDENHPQDGPDVDLRVRLVEGSVRIQAAMNLAFLDETVDAIRGEENALVEADLPELKKGLRRFFDNEVGLEIDGVLVAGKIESVVIDPYRISDGDNFPMNGLLAAIRVRITLRYPMPSPPESVALRWDPYPLNTALGPGIEADIDVKAEWNAFGRIEVVEVTKESPRYEWTAPKDGSLGRVAFAAVPKVPSSPTQWPRMAPFFGGFILALALALWVRRRRWIAVGVFVVGTLIMLGWIFAAGQREKPQLASEEASAIFRALHANIYRAFDYEDEDRVYDALAKSASGDLLDRLYGEIQSSLELEAHGGAICRIKKVEHEAIDAGELAQSAIDAPYHFPVEAKWSVLGEVYHWGHTHNRLMNYHARYRVDANDEGWRIAENVILKQSRQETESK